ncbi:RimK/LysX family protein [Endozoicomonas sp. Mp262]|uniref:putative ATP-dependent zinc protease n=1 Tax=Endozoicomonas sp. Mp262 TaxID=2919499 RepID=UPI0021D9DA81
MIRFPAVPAVLVAVMMTGCQLLPYPQSKTSEEATQQPTEQPAKPEKKPDIKADKAQPEDSVKQVLVREKIIQTPSVVDGRLILGVTETGFLVRHNVFIDAKMDTGADHSSIDARNAQIFERDGKKWVKFELHRTSKGPLPLEYPVKDTIKIKRPGEDSMERAVIEMTIRIGNITQQVRVTLNDRDDFTYPLLIGRNFIRDLAIVDVNQENIAEEKPLKSITRKVTVATQSSPQNQVKIIKKPVDTSGLVTIGAIEHVLFTETGTRLKARIDTGAKTSSLDARDLEVFKKNGQDWVRFTLPPTDKNNEPPVTTEFPVVRFVHIKRHGLESEERPVIIMQAQIGNIKLPTEFTLRDRSDYEFPVLIGTRFLKQSAIVDVSKKFMADHTKVDKKG